MSDKNILVQKFGGTSLADLHGFEASAAVIGQYAAEQQVVVVLSAVKGVTDLLLAAIDTAVEGGDGATHLREAIARERAIVEELAKQGVAMSLAGEFLQDQESVLGRRVEGIRLLGQCPDEARARILASGEGFSSRLMVDVLNHQGFRAQWSDADVLPLANEDWLDSLIDIEAAGPRLRERLHKDSQVMVLPGFYGRNENGDIQLLGRNGTDYSAAAIAAALGADLLLIARGEERLEQTRAHIESLYPDRLLRTLSADVATVAGRERVCEAAGESLQILVNNAGTNIRKRMSELSLDEYRRVQQVNLESCFDLCRLLHPALIRGAPAAVVNNASVAGLTHLRTGAASGTGRNRTRG